jgi:hypothetical protein
MYNNALNRLFLSVSERSTSQIYNTLSTTKVSALLTAPRGLISISWLECVLWAGNVNFDFPISSIGFDHSATLLPSASFTVISEPRRFSFLQCI